MAELLRYDIIQRLIDHHGYKSYLEIGIHVGNTWRRIKCDRKVGVDPELRLVDNGLLEMTSDDYFKGLDVDRRQPDLEVPGFDIIFIDGLHLADQVYRDFVNAVRYLNPGGCIVFHDANPPTLAHAGEEPEVFKTAKDGSEYYVWCGTVWKFIAQLGKKITQIQGLPRYCPDWFTVDTDWGVSVLLNTGFGHEDDAFHYMKKIEMSKSSDFPHPSWDEFELNRSEPQVEMPYRKNWLNLISVDEFNRRYPIHE